MFKRLLFGNEAKLQFKTSTTHGIARLYSQANIPRSDVAYWNGFLELFDSANDVFSLLSVADVRKTLIRHPENIATLVIVLVAHLETLKNDPDFSPVPESLSGRRQHDKQGTAAAASQALFDAGSRSAAALGSYLPGIATASSGSVASSSSSFSTGSGTTSRAPRNRVKEALNCCRILTRLFPVILEGDHDETCSVAVEGGLDQSAALLSRDFERSLLWTPVDDETLYGPQKLRRAPRRSSSSQTSTREDAQFVIEESDDEDSVSEKPPRKASGSDPLADAASATSSSRQLQSDNANAEVAPTLGKRLTSTIIELLFYAGFTIPWPDEPGRHEKALTRTHYVIWRKGVGSSLDLAGSNAGHEAHRLELLRLLLVLVSKAIFVPAHAQQAQDNPALRQIALELPKTTTLPLLCSLINVSVASSKGDDWLSGLTSLPAGLVRDRTQTAEDVKASTATLAFELLNVILGYEPPAGEGDGEEQLPRTSGRTGEGRPPMLSIPSSLSVGHSEIGKSATINRFRMYLGKLHRQSDFALLADGVFDILSEKPNPVAFLGAVAGTAPTADTSAAGRNVPDAIILLWRLMTQNIKFRSFLLEDRSPQLLALLLFHALSNKDNAARQGLVRLVAFILQDISCDRAFAVNICKAGSGGKARVPSAQRWGIATANGTLSAVTNGTTAQASQVTTGADVLIQGIYALIATTKSSLAALYPPLIIALTNISPYFRNLSILSSNRLVALFRSFTSPAFLLADEGNPRLAYYLIECLNNVITFGLQKNANLVYALVRNYHLVERLANFTLRRGIADIRRTHRRAGVAITEETPLFTPRTEHGNDPITDNDAEKSEMPASVSPLMNTLSMDAEAPSSEKARGKMRRVSVSSESNPATVQNGLSVRTSTDVIEEDEEDRLVNGFTEEELYFAASTVGRDGFVPDQTWVTSWHKGLPLDTLQLAMLELVPKVQDMCANLGSKSNADERILAFLREQNLEGILPPAPAQVQPRPFRWTPQVTIWLLSYVWGLIYVAASLPYGLFTGSCARLFQLRIHDANAAARLTPSSARSRSRSNTTGGESVGSGPASPRLFAAGTDQMALANVGNMVFGGISSVLGISSQSPTSDNDARNATGTTRTSANV